MNLDEAVKAIKGIEIVLVEIKNELHQLNNDTEIFRSIHKDLWAMVEMIKVAPILRVQASPSSGISLPSGFKVK
jgi:hypothetical protein